MPSTPFVFPQPLNIPAATGLSASGNSNPVSLKNKSVNMAVTFHIKFTLGSLTNATFVAQVLNPDTSTWEDYNTGTTGTLTANSNVAIPVSCPGALQARVRYASTGTATNSAVVIDATCQQ